MNSTISTATATTTATTTGYLNHWIRLNSGQSNASRIASLALTGKRLPHHCMVCGWNCKQHAWCELSLTMPSAFEEALGKMNTMQVVISRKIAQSFGHLWASFESPLQWADHYNNGCEDGHNPSNHPLPTPEDETASGRYKWSVDRRGAVNFEVNRPQGTACRVTGTITDFKIEITKLAMDRHLVCLHQMLQQIFGLSPDESVERIETAKGFSLMGIRGGELHRVVMTA